MFEKEFEMQMMSAKLKFESESDPELSLNEDQKTQNKLNSIKRQINNLYKLYDKEIIDKVMARLVKNGYINAKEIQKSEEKYPYYVTLYYLYPIYEPAEGGYYYNGIGVDESYGFQTRKKAIKFLRKRRKECLKEDKNVKWWYDYINSFGVYNENGYIGNGYFWEMERKFGSAISGYQPYC